MANNVSNKLEIHCQDSDTMAKIKKMIFDEKDENNHIFTMEVLLPRSMAFADSEHYDLNWNRATLLHLALRISQDFRIQKP